jgi:hypothetical protein
MLANQILFVEYVFSESLYLKIFTWLNLLGNISNKIAQKLIMLSICLCKSTTEINDFIF